MLITKLVIFVCLFLLVASNTFSQKPCVQFKHLEFFVPISLKLPNWSETQVSTLIAQPAGTDDAVFIPFIVKQLADYEPGCGSRAIDRTFELLIGLYAQVRPDDRFAAEQTAHEKLELIRKDFYRQINDDRLFKGLIFTMDDGPLMGKLVSVTSIKPLTSREFATPFGKLRFANIRGGVAVLAIDRKNRTIWSRMLGGVIPERTLREADLNSLTVEETDFVIVARLFVDGERLTLYTRPNGRFMYYTHSW